MNRVAKKTLKTMMYIVLFPILFLLGYALVAVLLTVIPANMIPEEQVEEVTIFTRSNGVHTDIVVPVKSDVYDWNVFVDTSLFQNKAASHLAFGWGDKGFYLNTPEWSDLKFSTAFNAMFRLSTAAMHVTAYKKAPAENERCKKITISKKRYLELVHYIQRDFQKTDDGKAKQIAGSHYSNVDDCFFDAHGKYSFWYTCNCWANNGLKVAGLRTALWAPFEKSIFYWR